MTAPVLRDCQAPLHAAPTSLILKLAVGETPEHIPTVRDVSRGHLDAATTIDGEGPVDRITRQIAGGFRAARLYPAAAHPPSAGRLHQNYDPIEHATGLAGTLMLRVPEGTDLHRLTGELGRLPSVSAAGLNYTSYLPFDAGDMPPVPHSEDGGWNARNAVRMREALALETGDGGVAIGLVDSGINPEHPELRRKFRAGFNTVRLANADVAPGVTLLGEHTVRDSRPRDRFVGHGMGCAGIIGAGGLAMPGGLAGKCRILPMRGLAAARLPSGKVVGIGAIADLDLAVKLAIDLGAKVVNMSFGTDDAAVDPNGPRPHADIVAYAMARGCILIAASGNNGQFTRYWPAAFPDVIAVGATGEGRIPAGFSTRGDHVAICAPGQKVLTTGVDGYQLASGTSFAAPFVAAAAGLLVAMSHRRARPIDAATVRRILIETAQPFTGSFDGCGAGVLDAAAALAALDTEIDRTPGYADGADADGGADDG